MRADPRGPRGLRTHRLRFAAALAVFLLWVAALGAMAILSARRPEVHPRAAAPPQ